MGVSHVSILGLFREITPTLSVIFTIRLANCRTCSYFCSVSHKYFSHKTYSSEVCYEILFSLC